MNLLRICILISTVLLSCRDVEPNLIKTTAIFSGRYKSLAVALQQERSDDIEKIVKTNNLNLNYVEPKYGISLLNWCILNHKEKSFSKLLQLGADVNWQDSMYHFAPSIIEAARVDYNSNFLKLCLAYGGNVNLLSKNMAGSEEQTPLFSAIYSRNMENIKLLVQNGADVNLSQDLMWTPLAEALIHEKIGIAKYLLDNGADYNSLKFRTKLGEQLNVLDFLKGMDFPLRSDEYKIKLEVIGFLKNKGLNYWNYPIPDVIRSQHKDDPGFLSKY